MQMLTAGWTELMTVSRVQSELCRGGGGGGGGGGGTSKTSTADDDDEDCDQDEDKEDVKPDLRIVFHKGQASSQSAVEMCGEEAVVVVAVVTVLGVLQQAYFSLQVIHARRKYSVSPPATAGPPEFERIFRAQSVSELAPLYFSAQVLWVLIGFSVLGVFLSLSRVYLKLDLLLELGSALDLV
ncbi:Leukotriene C4 synthase [Liparis tanakae]|uniref:Leukotriene C4 synthase n=1 Tax=Liparis tanakae TaxID=230148 RepID=A0A4Z2EMH3_9TELE|nr:Leukotriene C4 synthase [Liparis tanakae]